MLDLVYLEMASMTVNLDLSRILSGTYCCRPARHQKFKCEIISYMRLFLYEIGLGCGER